MVRCVSREVAVDRGAVRMRARFLTFALTSILLLVAVACGSQPASGGESGVNVSNSVSGAGAADFSIPVVRSVDGNIESSDFSLASNRGKTTVLYFSFIG